MALIVTEGAVLLILRAKRRGDRWSGQMALPGGRREKEDTDPRATVIREILEETGIRLKPGELSAELEDLVPRTPALPPVVVRPFVFRLKGKPPVHPNDEIAGHYWIGLNELRRAKGPATISFRGQSIRVVAFLVGPKPVWGMTYMILSGFLGQS